MGTKYCDKYFCYCLFVCLSVCLLVGLLHTKTAQPNFAEFLVHVACNRGSAGSILPVLWMTSCFHISPMSGHKARREYS